MTDFTPASRPHDAGEEPLLDSFLREAIPEIKLALGDAIDRDNSRAIPDRYVRMLPLTTLVVTLRPDAAQAVAMMAAELEAELTDSVMRHGSLYDRDYRVRLKEAGTRGAPLFRVSIQPAGQPDPEPIVAAPPPPPAPGPQPTIAAPEPRRPEAPAAAETLFAGRSPELMDPDATRVEGIAVPEFPWGRFELVVEDMDGTERERFPIPQPQVTVGRQTDKAELRSDIRITGFDTVSRRQLALVWAERDGKPGFTVYNLGLNAIHVGDREVSGANAGKGALDLASASDHSTWVPPGDKIRIGGHGPVVRIHDRHPAEKGEQEGGSGLELHVEPPVDPDATRFG
ncbi:MAG TPA: FHA domain-containing protein [Longimicrobium sp.]|nr:FHA domain-containing protein [Longimicrobium sp.]